MTNAQPKLTRDEEWKYAEKALTWYGWGSPVGAGLFLVCAGVAAVLIRFSIFGL